MSEPINTGGPAFPMQEPQAIHAFAMAAMQHLPAENTDERDRAYVAARALAIGGLTARDYFAAQAMQALISSANGMRFGTAEPGNNLQYAIAAYAVADAMLKAREGGAR